MTLDLERRSAGLNVKVHIDNGPGSEQNAGAGCWTIDGAPAGLNEICNINVGAVNGVTVEPYWSKFDDAGLTPTSVSIRRTLASVGKKLDGKGLLSSNLQSQA
jgi:hypothetical protein